MRCSRFEHRPDGNPFVVEDTITVEYQNIIQSIHTIQTSSDRNQVWTRYMEMHVSVERVMLDQGQRTPLTTDVRCATTRATPN